MKLLDESERFVAVARLADDVLPGELQGDAHRFAQHDVVVDDQDVRPAVHLSLDPLRDVHGIMGHGSAGVHCPKLVRSPRTARLVVSLAAR
jgi:hypothetical protein